jgi:hypothetical protein
LPVFTLVDKARRLRYLGFQPEVRTGDDVESDRRRALSEFYREEFLRHIERMEALGIFTLQALNRARHHVHCLDEYCGHSEFPVLAEMLLQRFDTLSRLSEQNPRQGH